MELQPELEPDPEKEPGLRLPELVPRARAEPEPGPEPGPELAPEPDAEPAARARTCWNLVGPHRSKPEAGLSQNWCWSQSRACQNWSLEPELAAIPKYLEVRGTFR